MARLNATKTKAVAETIAAEETLNFEGAVAYTLPAKERLIERVLGSFWNEKLFYESGEKTSSAIIADVQTVAKADPKFILQLAAYARNELYLRTAPQVLLVEASYIKECKPFIEAYTPKIVKRADELSEVVAYHLKRMGGRKNFANSLKRGLQAAFNNFDEYQLNKYDSSKAEVSLGDVVKLVHPNFGEPAYAKAMYNYLTKDEVDPVALPKIGALKALLAKDSIDDEALELIKKSNVTWETLISKFGSTKENWELVAPNMGYMALLRNLRNFHERGVDLGPILARIEDENEVKHSKQLPFRFFSAYKATEDGRIQRAVSRALDLSLSNVELDGTTAVLVDLSGSMHSPLSERSNVLYIEVGAVLGAIAVQKAHNSTVIGFGSQAAVVDIKGEDSVLSNVKRVLGTNVGYSTDAWKAFQLLDKHYDRVFLISDMQCYNSGYGSATVKSEWKAFTKRFGPSRLYSIDISAYGTKQTDSTQKDVTLLNGWSDKILDYANLIEKANVMENQIKKW